LAANGTTKAPWRFEPLEIVLGRAPAQRHGGRTAHAIPDLVRGGQCDGREGEVVGVAGQRHRGSAAAVEGVQVRLEQAGARGELGGDVRQIPRVEGRRGHGLTDGPARVLSVLRDGLGAADPVDLQRLEVGGLGSRLLGDVIGVMSRSRPGPASW
jgi:hypothetical protein